MTKEMQHKNCDLFFRFFDVHFCMLCHLFHLMKHLENLNKMYIAMLQPLKAPNDK